MNTCTAVAHKGISEGICVMIKDHQIVYAGPYKTSPAITNVCILLHPDDFAGFAYWLDHGKPTGGLH